MKSTENLNTNFLDRVFEKSREKTLLKMDFGNLLIVDTEKQEIKLLDKNKNYQFTITVKAEGLSLQINAIELDISAVNQLNLSGKKINLMASEEIMIKSADNLTYEIANDCTANIGGTNKNKAQTQVITADLGNVEIRANDDIKLDGERVKLNCD